MKSNKEKVYDLINLHFVNGQEGGISTQYISEALNMQRTNVSSILSSLVLEGKVDKTNGRPVLYYRKDSTGDLTVHSFSDLTGYNGSLKRVVQLAKAAVLYPEKSLNTVIFGAKGTGKRFLAKLMHKFAIQSGVFPTDSNFVIFDSRNYGENEKLAIAELFGNSESKGCFIQAQQGILFIDNAQYLSARVRGLLISCAEDSREENIAERRPAPMIIVSCDNKNPRVYDDFASIFPIGIELPALSERPLSERMEMIQKFLTLESARIKKTLTINAELLRCLLLYDCEANCMQLKADIKIGCANAYVREHNSSDNLLLYISDFDHNIRKGFLKYKTYREKIEEIIPYDYSYSISGATIKMSSVDMEKLKNKSIYDDLNLKAESLAARGLEVSEINLILSTELEDRFHKYQIDLTKQIVNKEQLSMLVDNKIIYLVESFLEEAAFKLGRNFSNSVYYGLCLHLNSVISNQSKPNKVSPKQITDILDKYKTEYLLSTDLILKIKKEFGMELPIDDVILITMFICYQTPIASISNKPVILFAFYGDGIAESISRTIVSLTHLENAFSFEIVFEKDMEEIYDSLKRFILKIERGKGIIVVYDSSFLSEMLVSMENELNIVIRQLPIPITTIGIELVRKAALEDNVDSVYQSVMSNMGVIGTHIKKVIVTLCTTGKGSAEELKHYIERYGKIEGMEIISLSISDRDRLREELVHIMKTNIIQCVVGTFDPKLFSISFISISEIFGTPKEKLPGLLQLRREEKKGIDYEEVFRYLEEQLEYTNVEKLKKLLPQLILKINEKICELSLDSEVGLFIHISCCIDRMKGQLPSPQNVKRDVIISKYNGEFKILLKLVKPLEKTFDIIFNDDEISNILTIIYKL